MELIYGGLRPLPMGVLPPSDGMSTGDLHLCAFQCLFVLACAYEHFFLFCVSFACYLYIFVLFVLFSVF